MRAQRRAASDATVVSVPARRRAVIEGPRSGWGRGGGSVMRLESLDGRLAVAAVEARMLGDLARSLRLTPKGQPVRFTRPGPDRSGPR